MRHKLNKQGQASDNIKTNSSYRILLNLTPIQANYKVLDLKLKKPQFFFFKSTFHDYTGIINLKIRTSIHIEDDNNCIINIPE